MKVLVDTSALFAILDADDDRHADANALFGVLAGTAELVTTNYIHVEAEQLVRRRLGPMAARDLLDKLLPAIATIWIDESSHRVAVEAQRAGAGGVSLVDHVCFVVMRASGIEVAFAYDAAFEAQGFRRPPGADPGQGHRLSEAHVSYSPESAPSDLVSVTEIAARAGRPVNTIQSWRRRHDDFPPPLATLAAGPVWAWRDVEAWVAVRERRGRRRTPGLPRGRVSMAPDFDAPLELRSVQE